MTRAQCFSETEMNRLRDVCSQESRLVAMYAFDLRRGGDCNLAALFTRELCWPERLELEVAVSRAIGVEGVELINLKRMPLVARFNVVERGDPVYVGLPDRLAVFIEETIVRYSAFYPLLEALYWKVETSPLAEDMLGQ